MKHTYRTMITQEEGLDATGIPVPADIVTAFGVGKKPKVRVTLNGYSYRSTVAAYGDVFMLPLNKEHRAAAGVRAGEEVEITLELDLEPRTVEVPTDLAAALAGVPGAREAFDALSYTSRKELVRQINEAKAPETRARRLARILASLQ